MVDRLVEKKGDEIRFADAVLEGVIAHINVISPVVGRPAFAIVVAQAHVGPDEATRLPWLGPHVALHTRDAILAKGDVEAFHRKLFHGISQHAPDRPAHPFLVQWAWAAEPRPPDRREPPVDHGTKRQRQPRFRVSQCEVDHPLPAHAERQRPRVDGVMASNPRIEAEQLGQPHDRPLALERTTGEDLFRILPAIDASVAFYGVIHALELDLPHLVHHALRGHVDVADHASLRVVEACSVGSPRYNPPTGTQITFRRLAKLHAACPSLVELVPVVQESHHLPHEIHVAANPQSRADLPQVYRQQRLGVPIPPP
mmetsp:Transcript_60019/g.173816  ORF Transcript_60019/g.173816 Transcript_60019/m.173816 type:complete len:313 (+) Transcript_60019:301-1239(+)